MFKKVLMTSNLQDIWRRCLAQQLDTSMNEGVTRPQFQLAQLGPAVVFPNNIYEISFPLTNDIPSEHVKFTSKPRP